MEKFLDAIGVKTLSVGGMVKINQSFQGVVRRGTNIAKFLFWLVAQW